MQEENAGEVKEVIQPTEEVTQPEVEQVEAVEAQEPEQVEEQPRDEKGRFKSVQDRIDELTKQRHDAEREAAYWKELATSSGTQAQKPKPEMFENYNDYVEALTDWKTDQKVSKALGQRDQDKLTQAEQKVEAVRSEVLAERLTAIRSELPDFDSVVGASEIVLPKHVMDAIQDADLKVAYYVAKNPAVAERLASMDQRAADREIGRLEARLEKPSLVTKPVSKAPEPITPIRGGSAGNVSADPEKMSPAEFANWARNNGSRWIK